MSDFFELTQTGPQEKLTGTVERIIFQNETNGYCVIRLNVEGEADMVTVVGYATSVSEGHTMVACGEWVNNKDYGRQFHAQTLTREIPTTVEGIELYLGSGMVKGIGPVLAKKLVTAFGTDVFTIIENEPHRLRELPGIGPKRIERIKNGWSEQKVVQDIMVFLQSHGVSTVKAVRIYKVYGQDAIKIVTDNPYRLAKDIRGIGFPSADKIALNIGIEPTSMLRARAGVNHALSEATAAQGHCCLPRPTLEKLACELLNVAPGIVSDAISLEIETGEVIEADFPQTASLYPAALFRAEASIAEHLKALAQTPPPWAQIDPDKAIPEVEEKLHITLAQSQREAVAAALKSKVLVITGGPGVGKTTIVKAILTVLEAKGADIVLCAPTGRAAKRLTESSGMQAKTIHRLLEVNPGTMGFTHNEDNPLECDLLVVDECSMVDVNLANHLIKAIDSHTAVIFVGDVDQLPSVGPGAFLADLIDSGTLPVIRLTEVFRQAASSWIVKVAHQINDGQFPNFPGRNDQGDCYFVNVEDNDRLPAVLTDIVSSRLPKAYGVDPVKDIQVLCPMNKGSIGTHALNESLQQVLNPPGEEVVVKYGTKFSVGDKVMQIENNYDRNVFNGDIGFVTKLDDEDKEMTVAFDGVEVPYAYDELDELVLCYATTIHKSQGSEYPMVVMPVTLQHYVMLKRNLFYTGVTRGKKLVVLVGQKKALAMAIQGVQTIRRHTGLKHWLAQA